MATLDDVYALLERIKADLPSIAARINPGQIAIVCISDLGPNLGLFQAGEFRTGNGLEPSQGFSGVRMGYPAFLYNGEYWHLVGVDNDVLQFALRANDGKALLGAGVIIMDATGITVAANGVIRFGGPSLGDTTIYNGILDNFGIHLQADTTSLTPAIDSSNVGTAITWHTGNPSDLATLVASIRARVGAVGPLNYSNLFLGDSLGNVVAGSVNDYGVAGLYGTDSSGNAMSLVVDGATRTVISSHNITAPNIAAMAQVVRAASDSSIQSDTTLHADGDLIIPVEANSVYEFKVVLLLTGAATADFIFGWTVPASTTIKWSGHSGLTEVIASGTPTTALTESGTLELGAGGAVDFFVVLTGIIVSSATPGNVNLTWGQRTSVASNSTRYQNSWLRYTKIS